MSITMKIKTVGDLYNSLHNAYEELGKWYYKWRTDSRPHLKVNEDESHLWDMRLLG